MKPAHELYVANFLKTRNKTAAAIAAGYSEKGASVQGLRLSRNPSIAAAIAAHDAASGKKKEREAVKVENLADRVMSELSSLAFGNMADLFDPETGDMLPIHKLPRDVAATLTAYENDKGFQKVKTASKMSALELLSKITQLVKAQDQFTPVQIIIGQPPALPERVDTATLLPEWE